MYRCFNQLDIEMLNYMGKMLNKKIYYYYVCLMNRKHMFNSFLNHVCAARALC